MGYLDVGIAMVLEGDHLLRMVFGDTHSSLARDAYVCIITTGTMKPHSYLE
jgi:hypothetical protein